MKADLHIHSNHSFDSTNSIENILDEACRLGYSYIAICDHNEFEGSIKAQKDKRINVIPAIEIDCYFNDDVIHVLGYGMSFDDIAFSKLKKHYINELDRIGNERLKLIEDRYNCKLDLDKIKALAIGHPFTNVEITRVLLQDVEDERLIPYQKGDKSLNPLANFYWDNLVIGKWGYVEIKLPDYKEVFDLIHRNHGVVICAHPNVNIKKDLNKINELIKHGVDGFEVYCSYHGDLENEFYLDICKQNNLLWTCGSDYHGITKPNIQLGDHNFKGDCSEWINPLLAKIYENKDIK